jgi:hypothetical protein
LPSTDGNRKHRRIFPILAVLGTLILAGIPALAAGGSAPAPQNLQIVAGPSILKIQDQQSISHLYVIRNVTLHDTITGITATPLLRIYTINVTTPVKIKLLPLMVQTQPLSFWSVPGQMPYGADNLPPLSEWTWWVMTPGGLNDTQNWSVDPSGLWLQRTTIWMPQSYTVIGRSIPTINVTVAPTSPDGSEATGGGFVVNAGGFPYSVPNVSGYPAMVSSLRPSYLRFSVTTAAMFASWNSSAHQPGLTFTGFDTLYQLAAASGADVLLSLPAGNWGDGNLIPNGTPINKSVSVNHGSMAGYFFTPGVMYALVSQIANHTYAAGETVRYWSVGNEVPLNGTTEVTAYIRLINAAIKAAHVLYPAALVGTDNMLSTAYLATFAKYAPKVGFLSFHYYPAWGMCVNQTGQYCPPTGQPNGTTTPTLFSKVSYWHGASSQAYMPAVAQSAWFNLTGKWLPVLNTETNLGATGGPGGPTWTVGPDPRIPDLTGAAWLGSILMDSSEQNVSQLGYFSLTSIPNVSGTSTTNRGGFGFGVTNVSPSGTITRFAPYYVMQLWNQHIPGGSVGLTTSDSDSASVRAYAVLTSGHVEVALASRVAVPVNIHLSVMGHYTLQQLTVLDSVSYAEQYDPTANMTSVIRSGVTVTPYPTADALTIHGYGFALAEFVLMAPQTPRITGANGGLGAVPEGCRTVDGAGAILADPPYNVRLGAPYGSGVRTASTAPCVLEAVSDSFPGPVGGLARVGGPVAVFTQARSAQGSNWSRSHHAEAPPHAPRRGRRSDRFHELARGRGTRPPPARSVRSCRRVVQKR